METSVIGRQFFRREVRWELGVREAQEHDSGRGSDNWALVVGDWATTNNQMFFGGIRDCAAFANKR
jgi:hypothetical protein